MSKLTIERKNLIEAVNTLPDEMLIELANFVEYLRYKTVQHQPSVTPEPNFLLTISGIGNSGQVDISDSDEEILRNEISALSPADKFRLVQLVLAQLAQEELMEKTEVQQPVSFEPRSFFGVIHQPKQVIDEYLANIREGWL